MCIRYHETALVALAVGRVHELRWLGARAANFC